MEKATIDEGNEILLLGGKLVERCHGKVIGGIWFPRLEVQAHPRLD